MPEDPFDDLLSLEDQIYSEGFQLGLSDGHQAGLAEGRVFGMEKGYEKYRAIGRVHGRSLVWSARLSDQEAAVTVKEELERERKGQNDGSSLAGAVEPLPHLPRNSRLEKHIHALVSLTDPSEIPTANTEEFVDDYEERLKKAEAKVQIIEKMIGERHHERDADRDVENRLAGGKTSVNSKPRSQNEGDIEDMIPIKARN